MLSGNYIINHILRVSHSILREYDAQTNKLISCYGEEKEKDILIQSTEFTLSLLDKAENYPVIYMEKYPIYYGIVSNSTKKYLVGPVTVEEYYLMNNGHTASHYLIEKYRLSDQAYRVPFCDYNLFCECILLLHNYLNNEGLVYQELNALNFISEDLEESISAKKSEMIFDYQESFQKHNPYDRERREVNSIINGNKEQLLAALDEVFDGEYAVLAGTPLRSSKNLGIIGLVLASRAAIEGGISSEESFSISDYYIRMIDSLDNIGEIEAVVRKAKLEYADLVNNLSQTDNTHLLSQKAKDFIFTHLHSKITVVEIAEDLGVSKDYLSRIFKKTMGVTIKEYIVKQKLQYSIDLLVNTDESIEQISSVFGFSSQSHYAQCFKRKYGISPNTYRKKYKK